MSCRIDTPKDFIEANLTWGRDGALPDFKTYFDESVSSIATNNAFLFIFFLIPINTLNLEFTGHFLAYLQDLWASQIKSRFSFETGYKDRHEKILKGNYAIIGKTVDGAYFPEKNVNSSYLKVLKIFNAFV